MPTSTPEHPTLAFPSELQALPQWVAWQAVPRPGQAKPAKVPVCPRTGANASPTDRATWGTFTHALDRCARDNLAGVGFVLTSEDSFVGIDLDHCRHSETGLIEDWAAKIVVELRTYTEISPSGTGLRLLVQGKLPPGGRRRGDVEMYDTARYLTITGDHLEGTPLTIEPRQAALEALHAEVFPDSGNPRGVRPPMDSAALMDDDTLVRLALNARNGEKFGRLFTGDTLGKASQSEADLALCAILAFWTQDPEQLDRLFRRSGLYREKWERADYRERTIQKAIQNTVGVYLVPRLPPNEPTEGAALIAQA
jgi:putative DNA primase/helicase